MRLEESGLALRAEEACIAGWPALREVAMEGWLLRFAGGHTGRSNSVNVVGPPSGDPARKIAACAELYRAEGLPTIFRLSTARPEPGLDGALDAAGFGPAGGETIVLHADLSRRPAARPEGVHLAEGPAEARWLAASAALAGLDAPTAALRARMFGRLAAPGAFASVEVDGAVAALAFGAMTSGLVCLNAVATAPEHRGRGLATRVVAALLDWAAARGAGGACLPVEAGNAAGQALYRRSGFATELSRYVYRDRA